MNAVISTNERAWILTDHVTFKLRYNQIYQMKTTFICLTYLHSAYMEVHSLIHIRKDNNQSSNV